ncbi:MAG: hypothetical protein ACPGWR_15190 [Ardenticatenaceae bacterium]
MFRSVQRSWSCQPHKPLELEMNKLRMLWFYLEMNKLRMLWFYQWRPRFFEKIRFYILIVLSASRFFVVYSCTDSM